MKTFLTLLATLAAALGLVAIRAGSVPILTTIECTGAYQDTLWDTPDGHITPGVNYDATQKGTASTSLFALETPAHPIGTSSWKLCPDSKGVVHEVQISNAEYAGYTTFINDGTAASSISAATLSI